MTQGLRSHLPTALVVLALALGAVTRGVGASWGDPCLLHIDEFGYNFHNAARTEYHHLREGWWRPDLISYGALPVRAFVLTRTLLAGDERARSHAARSADAETFLHRAYTFDPTNKRAYDWLRTARAMRHLSALLYTLAMLVSWRTARRIDGPRAGAFAAFALAGCAGAVSHAHYFTPEAFITLGLAMLVHACIRIAETDRWRDYLYAALAMLVVAGTKVTSAPVCALVALAAFIHQRDKNTYFTALARTLDRGRLWAAFSLATLAWFALNPAAALHAEWYFNPATHFSPIEQIRAYQWGARLPDWALFFVGRGRTYVLRQVLADAMGRPLELLALLGVASSLMLDRGAKRLPALAALLVLGPLFLTQLQTIRYTVPALGVLAICAARLTAQCLDASEKTSVTGVRWLLRVGVMMAVFAIAHGVFLSIAQTAVYRAPDNRVAAARWIAARIHPGEHVVLEDHPAYAPPLGNEWGEGIATGAQRVPYVRLWSNGEGPHAAEDLLNTARFVALDGWNDRLVNVPESWRRHPDRTRFYAYVRAHGAPAGFRRVARFDNRPHLFGWWADERASELLSVMFDHIPITVYERLPAAP